MGGYGSGSWRGRRKLAVEECLSLSVGTFREALAYGPGYGGSVRWACRGEESGNVGYRTEEQDGELFVRLLYTRMDRSTGEREDLNDRVLFTTTRPHFGGRRRWFLCPLCSRRVGTLHLPLVLRRARSFGCRECYNLTYQSAQAHDPRTSFFRRNPEALEAALQDFLGGGKMNCSAHHAVFDAVERGR